MAQTTTAVETLTREIRACFHRLKALVDAQHRELDMTAAQRGVLESLREGGEQTVPQIARSKRVTRQHIQVLVNKLVESGLVETRANDRDRRSPRVALTDAGRAMFDRMRERERGVVAGLALALAACDLDATRTTLEAMHAYLDGRLESEGSNGNA